MSLCVHPMALSESPLGAGDLRAAHWAVPPATPHYLQATVPSILGPSAPAGSLPEGQVDSLLSIISSQRERFRARNQELEAVSHVPHSPTLHGPEDTVEDTQVQGRKTCHRPQTSVGLDLFCVVREGCLEEVTSHWALKGESDPPGKCVNRNMGSRSPKGVQGQNRESPGKVPTARLGCDERWGPTLPGWRVRRSLRQSV